MIVTCWSVKGGSGTSVVAGGLAVGWAAERPVLAVDLAGDLPAVIGIAAPSGPGVVEWLHAGSGVGAAALHALAVDAVPGLRVLHRGGTRAGGVDGRADDIGRGVPDGRWAAFAEAMAAVGTDVVIDAGLAPLPPELAAHTDASLLVIRPCFLALRRLSAAGDVPAGAIVIAEPGRALGRRDIERVLGIRIAAEMRLDPAVARAVDAGLLASRLPASLTHLAKAVDRWAGGPAVAARRAEAVPLPGFPTAADSGSQPVALVGAPERNGSTVRAIAEPWR
jgi:hypothetical protein